MAHQFEILQLLLEGNYNSDFYTFIGKEGEELHFRRKSGELCIVSQNGINKSTTSRDSDCFSFLIGSPSSVDVVKELLNNSAYIGCMISHHNDAYYFKKFGKIYELKFHSGDVGSVSFIDDDCNYSFKDILDRFEKPVLTRCEFDKFTRSITQIPNIKSARN